MNNIVIAKKNKIAQKKDGDKRDKRGRPSVFESKKSVAAVLRNEVQVTRFHMMQLIDMGYLKAVPLEKVKPGRGRRPYGYELTSKGKGLVALSKNWFGKNKSDEVHDASEQDIVAAAEIIEGDDNVNEDNILEAVADTVAARQKMEALHAAEEAADALNENEIVSEEVEDIGLPGPSNDDVAPSDGWALIST